MHKFFQSGRGGVGETTVRTDERIPDSLKQFRLLVSHLLERFFNNEMLSVGGETLPLIMTISGAIAVPTLVAAIFLFFPYHAFPPKPPVPPFWSRVCEHYFYVVYSMVAMGAVTVFEADLLFPDVLDLLVLSPLPIPHRRLLLARVSASLIFLVLFLLGMNSLGILAYPPATEFHAGRLFIANLTAVLAAGAFSTALVVAAQGFLICITTHRLYRQASALFQCAAIAALLSILLSFLKVSPLLNQFTAESSVYRWFPPFWFLGLYECILAGPSRLPQFVSLAHMACAATLIAVLLSFISYPLAYLRRSRDAIEGVGTQSAPARLRAPFRWILHRTHLRIPAQRAIYHFIGQNLRAPKHRVYLAMYAGLGIALVMVSMLSIRTEQAHIVISLSSSGLRFLVPATAFWVVSGLSTVLASPADPRGGWVFRVIGGAPTSAQLDAVRVWVTLWSSVITLAVVIVFWSLAQNRWQHFHGLAGPLLIAVALCVLLSDAFLLTSQTIPFTEIRIPRNTDVAWVLLRYIIAFPAVVSFVAKWEPLVTSGVGPAIIAVAVFIFAHRALLYTRRQLLNNRMNRLEIDDAMGTIPGLGFHAAKAFSSNWSSEQESSLPVSVAISVNADSD